MFSLVFASFSSAFGIFFIHFSVEDSLSPLTNFCIQDDQVKICDFGWSAEEILEAVVLSTAAWQTKCSHHVITKSLLNVFSYTIVSAPAACCKRMYHIYMFFYVQSKYEAHLNDCVSQSKLSLGLYTWFHFVSYDS